jgi:hypothetical protein
VACAIQGGSRQQASQQQQQQQQRRRLVMPRQGSGQQAGCHYDMATLCHAQRQDFFPAVILLV